MQRTKPPQIAVVHAEVLPIPPILGGAIGQIVYETVQGMPEIDWVVISRWDDALQGVETDSRFRYVDIDARMAMVKHAFVGRQKVIKTDVELRRFCYLDGVVEILKKNKFDLVQVENRPAFIPYLKKRLPNTKMLLYLHNEADFLDSRVALGLRLCDRMVFVSCYLRDAYLEKFPQYAHKSVVVHNGVDTALWHPKQAHHSQAKVLHQRHQLSNGHTVLFVGRTTPEKGLHCLFRAMKWVHDKMPGVKLVVVGSPMFGAVAKNNFVTQLMRQTKTSDVVFTGFVDREHLPYYYATADVVVVPSLFEDPFPTVVLEAMASGKPVVGSRRGGIPEMVVASETGFLVDEVAQGESLAHAILKILKSKTRRQQFGKQARKIAEKKFVYEKRWKTLCELYRSM